MKAKILIVVLSLVLTLSVGGIAIASEAGLIKEEEPSIVFSIWGDSIAEAVLGASPIGERDGYAYSSVIGRVANFEFHNRSVSGHLTSQMFDYVTASDDGARMNNTLLKTSDIIGISILGNDLLQNDISGLCVEYAKGDRSNLDYYCGNAKADLYLVLDYIRSVNPDAKIMMQTVYNPMYVGSCILREDAAVELKELGIKDEEIRDFGGVMLSSLNAAVYDYDKEHPGAITVVDVNKRFDEIYKEDPALGKELLYNDGVHPSNEGHAVIAELYLEKFIEWGYVEEKDAVRRYKALRVDQLERLYEKEDISATKKAIKKAKTLREISSLYFRFAEDKTAVMGERATAQNPYTAFEETQKFYISTETTVLGLPVGIVLDQSKSYIEFYDDGTMRFQIMLPKNVEFVNTLLEDMDLSSMDPSEIVDKYAVELFPGFTLSDVDYSLGLLKDSLDLSFINLDYEHEGVKALVESLETTGRLPATLNIPGSLGVEFTGRYTLRAVENPLTNEKYTAIHMGAPYENGDGYVIMTLTENAEGNQQVYFNIDFLQMKVVANKIK